MYFDGDAHTEGADTRVVFVTSYGEVLPYSLTLTQHCSNNVGEYQALLLGLKMVVDMKQLQLQIDGDSKLVINQVLGNYEMKKPELLLFFNYAQKMIGWLGEVTIKHIPRKENKKFDVLAALASALASLDQIHVAVFRK